MTPTHLREPLSERLKRDMRKKSPPAVYGDCENCDRKNVRVKKIRIHSPFEGKDLCWNCRIELGL